MTRQRVDSLIPGLPDDVAMLCLLRVPRGSHDSCRRVSKRWHSIFKSSRRFSRLRKVFGFEDRWLLITGLDQHTKMFRFRFFNLTTLSWSTKTSHPPLYEGRGNVATASIPRDGVLFVFGGVQCYKSTVNMFLKYEIREDRWTVIKAMIGELGYITAGFIDGKVYVTGLGNKSLSDGEHETVEAFDPKDGTWKPVPNYKRTLIDPQLTGFNGKLLLTYCELIYGDRSMKGRVYDTRADRWEDMPGQLREGLRTGHGVEIHGHLFVLSPGRRCESLKVYDPRQDRWDIVEGGDVPKSVEPCYQVCSWDGQIYVVRNLLCVAVGNVSRISCCCGSNSNLIGCRFRVEWEVFVDTPVAFFTADPVSVQLLVA